MAPEADIASRRRSTRVLAVWPHVTARVDCGAPPVDNEIRFGDDED